MYILCLVREMLPAIEIAQRTVHIYKKLYIRNKRELNWFLLFYCKLCVFQHWLFVLLVVVDSHPQTLEGPRLSPPRSHEEIL